MRPMPPLALSFLETRASPCCCCCAPHLLLLLRPTHPPTRPVACERQRTHHVPQCERKSIERVPQYERDPSCMRERGSQHACPNVRERQLVHMPQCEREGGSTTRMHMCLSWLDGPPWGPRLVVQGHLVQYVPTHESERVGSSACYNMLKQGETIKTYVCNICVYYCNICNI
jgi:hypothetical protein